MSGALVGSLVEALAAVPDPRKRRGVRHPCAGLVALAFLGCLCRLSELAALQRWAKRHWRLLAEPLGFDRPAPPHATTISRVLARCCGAQLELAFTNWLLATLLELPLEAAAVDGKTSKQAHDAAGDPLHTLNVFVHDLKVCLGQWTVGDGKETEPEVLKAHLKELFDRYPGLSLLTGDALFCQRPLAALIIDAARHYLLAVKDNQPDMMEALHTTFDAVDEAAPHAKTVEKRGAHIETRKIWVDCDVADYIREKLGFPGARLAIRLDREVRSLSGAVVLCESRYFITSLDPEVYTAKSLLDYVRGHWQVENSLHFILDRWWDQDRHYSKRAGLAQRRALLHNIALTLLRLVDQFPEGHPIRARADDLAWDPARALQILGLD
jgi:predicted transposase YbfD/YdcC